jgi:hypothetical protein
MEIGRSHEYCLLNEPPGRRAVDLGKAAHVPCTTGPNAYLCLPMQSPAKTGYVLAQFSAARRAKRAQTEAFSLVQLINFPARQGEAPPEPGLHAWPRPTTSPPTNSRPDYLTISRRPNTGLNFRVGAFLCLTMPMTVHIVDDSNE